MADELFEQLESDGYKCLCYRRDIPIFRKVVHEKGNSRGYWKAIVEGEIIDITYGQAVGYEGITEAEKMGIFVGKKLGLYRG